MRKRIREGGEGGVCKGRQATMAVGEEKGGGGTEGGVETLRDG